MKIDVSKSLKIPLLFWTPRLLSVLFILLVGMFSLDVFGAASRSEEILLAFLIHNIPTLILLVSLLLGWRRGWVGAAGFLLFGARYLWLALGGGRPANPTLGGISLLIGVLFLAGWLLDV